MAAVNENKHKPGDGGHRKSVAAVEVTPLEPPFSETVVFYRFANGEKILALSKEDAELVKALTGNRPGADIVLEKSDDPSKIKIHLTQ
jgi:hypothetical protein